MNFLAEFVFAGLAIILLFIKSQAKTLIKSFRYAEESDLPFLRQQADEVFEPKERLDDFIHNKGIVLYQIADKTIGCGFLTQIHPKFNYYDVGVWVDLAYRQKGYATQIISHFRQGNSAVTFIL